MKILEVVTNEWREVTIEEFKPEKVKGLTEKRYFFNWRNVEGAAVFKLNIVGNKDIKGLMALVDFPSECRIEIKLITASKENIVLKKDKGRRNKEFEGIIGALIAFAGKQAIAKYGKMACVSLLPKTNLRSHYIKEYSMIDAGRQLYLLHDQLNHLILKYSI